MVAWLAFTGSLHVHLCRMKERQRNRDGIERERIWGGWRVRGRDVTCPLLNASHSKQWLPPPNGHESQSWYERLGPTASEPNHTLYQLFPPLPSSPAKLAPWVCTVTQWAYAAHTQVCVTRFMRRCAWWISIGALSLQKPPQIGFYLLAQHKERVLIWSLLIP